MHRFDIDSMQALYSRAACFMPVVLLTSFRDYLAFAEEGCAWLELHRAGALVLYGHAGRESPGQI